MRNTRIVVKALTPKGRAALKQHMLDEVALRERFKGVPRWKIPRKYRSYLRTVSAFMPDMKNPVEHQIMGFSLLSDVQKADFFDGVKAAFVAEGCSLDDFGVEFFDS